MNVHRFVDRIIDRAGPLTIGVGALSLVALVYLATVGLQIDYNIESFLPANDPVMLEYRVFADKYEPDDGIILIGFEHEDVFSHAVLTDIAAISDSLEGLEGVDRVESLTTYRGLVASDDGLAFRRLINRIEQDPRLLEAQKAAILSDPLAPGFIVNPEGTVAAVFVYLEREITGYAGRNGVIQQIEGVLAPYHARYHFRTSGIPILRNGYVESIQDDTLKYLVLNSIVIALALFWLFRSLSGVVLPLVIVYVGGLFTVSIMTIAGSSIDVLSSTTSAIILVVGVADFVHLQSKYNEGIRSGLTRRQALREMLVRLGAATFLTSVTTAIGFFTLATSNIVPMRRFGIYAALGVLLTFVVSVLLVSAMLRPTRVGPRQRDAPSVGVFDPLLNWVDGVTLRYPGTILVCTSIVLVLAVAGATRLRVNSHINDDLGPKTELFQDQAFFQDNLSAPFPLEILVSTDRPDAFKSPRLLRKVDALQSYLDSLPSVSRTISIVDLIVHLDRTINSDQAGRIPDSPDLIAQYLLLREMSDDGETDRLASFDYSEIRLSALMKDVGSYRLTPILAAIDSVIAEVFEGEQVAVTKSGTIIIAASVSQSITRSLLVSIALAFVFISLIMAAVFRDLRYVVISLIPNVIPLLVTAGVMGYAAIEIKPATAVIFSIAFGIAVDDTIHFLARLRQELREQSVDEAIRTTLRGTGRAILMTSIILVAGFLTLATSRFESTSYMGVLISITILFALLADLLVLPALVRMWIKKGAPPADQTVALGSH